MTIYQFGKEGDDQRLEHRGDKVYVFDWSGDIPETTDDGPLYVDVTLPANLTFYNGVVRVSVYVVAERDSRDYVVDMSLRCFEQLCMLKPAMRVERDSTYRKIALQILGAEKIVVNQTRS